MGGSLSKLNRLFFFTSLLCKTLMRFCFVSIVKREHLLLPNFDLTKKSLVVTHFLSQKIEKKRKLKNTRRKPKRLLKLVVKDQDDK
jgi:hypothetical protein